MENVQEVQESQQSNQLESFQEQNDHQNNSRHVPHQSDLTVNSNLVSESQMHRQGTNEQNNEPLFQHNEEEDSNEYSDEENKDQEGNESEQGGNEADQSKNVDDEELKHNHHGDQQQAIENRPSSQNNRSFSHQEKSKSEDQSDENNETFVANQNNESNKDLFRQVPTEQTEQKVRTQQTEDNPQLLEKMLATQDVLDKFKQVIQSPKTRSPQQSSENPYQLKQPLIKPQSFSNEQNEQVSEKQIENNLKEIYKFYARQVQSSNKQNTFDQLQQISNVMTLQKFMYFCKDFQLIDLQITDDFLYEHTGQAASKPIKQIKYKHKEKENFVVTKTTLLEIFKRCSNISELSFQEFVYALIKIANVVFPVEDSLKVFYDYLGVHDPKIYRKKMVVVGKAFNSKDQAEVLTQEKIFSRRLILPAKPKPRAESVRHDQVAQNINNISVQEKPKQSVRNITKLNDKPKNYIKWEDLNTVNKDFDPKDLLLEQDLSDKEDEYYLKEYQITEADKGKNDDNNQKNKKEIMKPPILLQERVEAKQQVQPHLQPPTKQKIENKITNQLNKFNDNQSQAANSIQTQSQKIQKPIVAPPPNQQSPTTNMPSSYNQTPLVPTKQVLNSNAARSSIESNTFGYSVKAQMNKLNKVLTKVALNTSVEQGSPNTMRKDADGLNTIKKIEAEKNQREQQIFTAFVKNQELREKKVNKK